MSIFNLSLNSQQGESVVPLSQTEQVPTTVSLPRQLSMT